MNYYIHAVLFGGVLLLLCVVLVSSAVGADGWWNTSWQYRRAITINNIENPHDLFDYQVKIVVPRFKGMNYNFSDIRFIYKFGSKVRELPHWIENFTNESAIVWVKVPFIPKTSNTTIYMYYGNPSAVSVSNATNTFIRVIDGVVGNWHFDEGSGNTVYDSSGNGNDGTVYGASWVDGKFGKALSFDGVDDYVEVPDSASLDITDEITIEAWVKGYDFATDFRQIVGKSPDAVLRHLNFAYDLRVNKAGPLIFSINNGSWQNVTATIEEGKWYHVVGTYDGSEMRLYVNGELKDIKSVSGSIITNDAPVSIGRLPAYDYWNGTIDEVCIYNRALSAEEISDLYNNYGYTTTNYPGKVLVRKYTEPEPTVNVGFEQSKEFYISLMTDKTNYSTGEVINLTIEANRTQEYPQVMKFKLELEDLDEKPDTLIETGSFVMPAEFHKKVVLRFAIPESPFVSSGRYAFKAYLIEPSLDEVLAYDAVYFNVTEKEAKAKEQQSEVFASLEE